MKSKTGFLSGKLAIVSASISCAMLPAHAQMSTYPVSTQLRGDTSRVVEVGNKTDLLNALSNQNVSIIKINSYITGLSGIPLRDGLTIDGKPGVGGVQFVSGSDGFALAPNSTIRNLVIDADPNKRAIYNSTDAKDFGTVNLENLRINGLVQFLATGAIAKAKIVAKDVDVVYGDATGYTDRPAAFNVQAIPGVLTIWNQSTDPNAEISAELTGISVGRPDKPALGSGIFVSGTASANDVNAVATPVSLLKINRIQANDVYVDSTIPQGTAGTIAGGVFVSYGSQVGTVLNNGNVATQGTNAMVLDNWGTVDKWIVARSRADKPIEISSQGDSGIGFVNFGNISELKVDGKITTYGSGARGFNDYVGSIESASFYNITTHGNGAVGIQIAQPISKLSILNGIQTFGGVGSTLVKGVITQLPAIALSIESGGGSIGVLDVTGGLSTDSAGIQAYENCGTVKSGSIDFIQQVPQNGAQAVKQTSVNVSAQSGSCSQ
jgi:hypothetical protein